jgi:ABC-type multidrug transport system ATPase subunit
LDEPVSEPSDGRVVVTELTKVSGGRVRAVNQQSFTVEPGSVTGFLGPNGSGKTTTLPMLLGLVHPTLGRSTGSGVPYSQLVRPLTVVGAALEALSYHPARSGRNHAAEGRTVLVSSHLLNEVQEFADRVMILDRGRLIRSGATAELTASTDTVIVPHRRVSNWPMPSPGRACPGESTRT